MEYQKLNVNARGCMLVNEIIFALISTIVIGVIQYFLRGTELPFPAILPWFLDAVIWVLCVAAPFFRYNRYRYRFSEEDIDVKKGFLFQHRDIVPIERLHKVALESGPIDRIFGLSKVIVTTAGGDVVIHFIEEQEAEKIVDKLKARINQYAIESREES